MARRYLTADLPPLELSFRETPEDFEVDEVPLYEASGEGDHTYVRIEKRGVATAEAVRGIAKRLGRRERDIGLAGLKDAKAVARQTISIEHLKEEDRAKIDDPPRVRAIAFARHRNKLKTGHLKGNRFRIVLRAAGTGERELEVLRAALERLARDGVPNHFGPQRFGGEGGRTHELGLALLRGDAEGFVRVLLEREDYPPSFTVERQALRMRREGASAERIAAAIPERSRFFYVSAAQAAVFNDLLDDRLERGALARLEAGDVAMLHRNGASFLVEDPEREQPRADRFEISPAGPLFGTRLLEASGAVRAREEQAVRARLGDRPPTASLPTGDRRPYRVPLSEVEAALLSAGTLRVGFFLPAGSYATAVISEVLKRDVG